MKGKLKFLNMEVISHPLIEENLCFSAIASSRVLSEEKDNLSSVYGNIYVNNLMAICGKNATGKTTILRLLIGMMSLLTSDTSIQNTELKYLLFGKADIKIAMYFYSEDHFVYKDVVTFSFNNQQWGITSEVIYRKKLVLKMPKKNILDFDEKHIIYNREELSFEMKALLQSTNSLFRIISAEYTVQNVYNTLIYTEINMFDFYKAEEIPQGLLEFLDPTIEYFKIDFDEDSTSPIYKLKFKNSNRILSDINFATLMQYLSSGTIKAITLFAYMVDALKNGGILFIDELENHFNHGIIKEIIECFSNPIINRNAATLIFTTHFSEILNTLRADSIYISNKENVITSKKYSDFDIRSDLLKEDVFDAGYGGMDTAISYHSIQQFEMALKRAINNEV